MGIVASYKSGVGGAPTLARISELAGGDHVCCSIRQVRLDKNSELDETKSGTQRGTFSHYRAKEGQLVRDIEEGVISM